MHPNNDTDIISGPVRRRALRQSLLHSRNIKLWAPCFMHRVYFICGGFKHLTYKQCITNTSMTKIRYKQVRKGCTFVLLVYPILNSPGLGPRAC